MFKALFNVCLILQLWEDKENVLMLAKDVEVN